MKPLAVLDTSVVILLLGDSTLDDAAMKQRRQRVDDALKFYADKDARFALPTPVVAELCRDGPGSVMHDKLARALARRVRTLPLDMPSADAAGAGRRLALKSRAPGQERGAMLYDALIFGVAEAHGARWLLSANARDYAKIIAEAKSKLELVNTDEFIVKGQLSLMPSLPAGPATQLHAAEETADAPPVGEK